MKPVENCENCGRAIGRLEQPYVWRKHVVCAACHVHLSTPAPAAAASRPAQAAGPLPKEHYHPRVAPPKPGGPEPAPVALQPTAPAPQAAPMLLCATCGRAYAFGDVVSDHGKVICKTCALAAAAEKAKSARREKRAALVKKATVAAVILLAVGGGTAATVYLVKTRPDRTVAALTEGKRPSADAAAEQIMSAARSSHTPSPEPTTRPAPSVEAPTKTPVTLFPPPDALPDNGTPPAAAASVSPSPKSALVAPPGPTAQVQRPERATNEEPAPGLAAVMSGRTGPTERAPAPAQPEPEAPARARPAPPPEGTVERFVHDGRQLLNAGKYPLALEQFNLAMKKDRNHADAWHGSALCLQGMGDRAAALERLEKAVTLYNPPDRAAVFNCAAANLRDNPMRAAKMIRDYLGREGADPAERDEAMHGLMGKALFSVNRQGRQNKVWAEAQEFYFAYNQQLEMARTDGRGRWGAEWVPLRDAREKWDRVRSRWQNLETLRVSADRAKKAKDDAWDKLQDQRRGMRLVGDREQREAQQRWEQAAKQDAAVKNQLRAAEVEFNSLEKPPYPQVIKMVPMNDPPRSPGHAAR